MQIEQMTFAPVDVPLFLGVSDDVGNQRVCSIGISLIIFSPKVGSPLELFVLEGGETNKITVEDH